MHLKTLEKELLSRSLPERIQFISSYFAGERLVFSTSFGQEDQAITQAIVSTKSPIEIFTLDTGRQFQESYELMDLTIKK
jgi:phosphoadenosine phosphosulfate reductase